MPRWLKLPMRPARRSVLVAAMLILASPVLAQTPEFLLNQTARAIARISLIEPICGPFYLLDRKMIAGMERAFLEDGLERFGEAPLRRAVNAAGGEFRAQVSKMGAAVWCPAQRKHYYSPGVQEFIGQPLQ